jgi:hypothetical protein
MNIGAARGRQHCEAFPKASDQLHNGAGRGWHRGDLGGGPLRWATAGIADVMKFVCERVLEFFAAYGGIEIEKDGRVVFDVEDETVFAWFDYGIDFRANACVAWKVG